MPITISLGWASRNVFHGHRWRRAFLLDTNGCGMMAPPDFLTH
jgi:hypothetical protein